MRSSQVSSYLPVLLLVLVVFSTSSASKQDLRYQHLLQSVQAAPMPPQGWTWQAVEKLLSQSQWQPQPEEGATNHVELQRSADNTPAQPTRKAGCRNMYWKGPTAC